MALDHFGELLVGREPLPLQLARQFAALLGDTRVEMPALGQLYEL